MRHLVTTTLLSAALVCTLSGETVAQTPAAQQPADQKAGRPSAPESASDPARPAPRALDPARFGKVLDEAFGAYQRGHYLTAVKLALPRAEAGDAAAQTLVAEIYARGLGVHRDGKEAAKWYGKAAEQGDPDAQLQYALMLLDGEFVEHDFDRAYTLMRKAAEAGKPLAQFNLAQMMVESGAKAEEAVAWYERAANAGLPDAQYAMAQVHANGFGGKPKDDAAARRWLLRAAQKNFDTAQLDLGTWLIEGRGGEKDPEEGFAWLSRAAESGNVAAQNRVAKLYMAGIGTEPDSILAASWYITARRSGLTDMDMEDFLAGLTDEQIEQATERANRLR
ncbi:tetratricopeptide repeat protein [Chelativorans sp. AA-79]|uniref:tetratricopeptide repeat protein n=1 Tax=Chelativorans sp. AA-79 TaxID=3028735 RepID=UPI0023F8ED9A|nr:tetratricopeptide repeat protein [Chelativorans sp. AA-79]WEX09986.1 tetratricopeptide repeat protein [Chelativorans sp. AA-79]